MPRYQKQLEAKSKTKKKSKVSSMSLFDDSDEENLNKKEAPSVPLYEDSDEDQDDEYPPSKIQKISEKPSKPLFENDDDDNDSTDNDEISANDFKVKPQYEGKSGHKLLALQSKHIKDERFKFDAKFKDDEESEEEESSSSKEDEDDDEQEDSSEGNEEDEAGTSSKALAEERAMSLKILSGIIGEDKVSETKQKKSTVKFKDSSKMRFDPDQKDHSKFEIEDDEDSDGNLELTKKATETPMPDVAKDQSYWLKAEAFTKESNNSNQTSGFTFSFGSSNEEASKKKDDDSYSTEEIKEKKKKSLNFLEKNPFKYDSSSEDEEDNDETTATKPKAKLKKTSDLESGFAQKLAKKSASASGDRIASEKFFFQFNDKRFQEAEEFLQSGKDIDSLRENYDEKRRSLSDILKKKLRNKAKKQKDFLKSRRGKKGFKSKGHVKWKNGKRISAKKRKLLQQNNN